jgi:iron complex outermembrane recepter protein
LKVKRQFVLRLGVRNLFDRSPPIVTSGNPACYNFCAGNTYPQLYDPLGRYLFAGVTFNR